MEMGAAWKYLERLSRHPHRGSATPAEAAAADAIAAWLRELGYLVDVQGFRAPRDTLYLGPAMVIGGLLVGVAAGSHYPWVGLLICAVALFPLVGELLAGPTDLDRLLPLYPSQNVVVRQRWPVGKQRRTLVISAHYDTQRASYLFHPLFAPHLQTYFYVVYAGLALIPLGLALRWVLPGSLWAEAVVAGGAILSMANAAFLLVCRATGRHINGANDNGTGTALVLALAEALAQTPLDRTDVVFLFTGCEEVGMRGMKHFVRHAGLDKANTMFINLDNIGGGSLHYLKGEGMLGYRAYADRLVALAGRMSAELGGRVRPRQNLLLPSDGLIPAAAGYEAISFLAFSADGRLPNYHWYTDRLELVDRDLVDFAERFMLQFVRRAAASASQVQ